MKKYIWLFLIILIHIAVSPNVLTDKDYENLANSLSQHGNTLDAIQYYKKALKNNPNNMQARVNLIVEFLKKEQYKKSLKHLYYLIDLLPKNFFILKSTGEILSKVGRYQESIDYLKQALQIQPHAHQLYNTIGIAYLSLGDMKHGYKYLDMHLEQDEKECPRLWKGGDVKGKTVFIWDTVGAGDVFCFIRYAKQLKQKGATVVLGLRKSMIPLVSSCKYIDKIIPRTERVTFDYYVHMHKLSRMAYKAGFSVATDIPYLFADNMLLKKWQNTLAKDTKFKVGICWHANVYKNKEGQDVKNKRSIPLHYFYALSKVNGISLYSLQQVHGTDELAYMPKDFNIHVFDEKFDKMHGSFSDTAAVMKQLDLVITADTSIAHLAGALGVPVWVILPYAHNSRWTIGQGKNRLYESLRLFKQDAVGNWQVVMQDIANELKRIIN